MPMILVKKNPRGKVIRELSSEEETAVKTVCGLKRPATMAQHGGSRPFPLKVSPCLGN